MGTARVTKIPFIAVIGLTLAWGAFLASHRWVWNLSDSVNPRVGYLSDAPVKRGDYVHFDFHHPLLFDDQPVKLTKRLACEAGDIVTTVERDLYCNGRFVAHALTTTGSGKPLAVFVLDGPIPPGKVLLLGDSDTSFDGRYWGLMDRDRLQKVVPVI